MKSYLSRQGSFVLYIRHGGTGGVFSNGKPRYQVTKQGLMHVDVWRACPRVSVLTGQTWVANRQGPLGRSRLRTFPVESRGFQGRGLLYSYNLCN